MKGIRFLAVPVLVCGLAMSMSASAQDMSFGLEETGQSRAPVKLGKPSKRLAEALSAFEGKNYEAAAMGFERVAAGKSKDGRGNRQRAQFLLGQSLYQMGYYQSALTVFDDISAEGPGHLYFGETLEWLGLLGVEASRVFGDHREGGPLRHRRARRVQREESGALQSASLFDGATSLRAGLVPSGHRCLSGGRPELRAVHLREVLRRHLVHSHAPGPSGHRIVPFDPRGDRCG